MTLELGLWIPAAVIVGVVPYLYCSLRQQIDFTMARRDGSGVEGTGTTVAAAAERFSAATVRASVHRQWVASDLRPGPRARAQAAADPCVRIQSGVADAPSGGGRHAPGVAEPPLGVSVCVFWGANGPPDRLAVPSVGASERPSGQIRCIDLLRPIIGRSRRQHAGTTLVGRIGMLTTGC